MARIHVLICPRCGPALIVEHAALTRKYAALNKQVETLTKSLGMRTPKQYN